MTTRISADRQAFLSSPVPVRNIAFTLLSVAAVILLLQFMQAVLIPFVLATLLFYALDPAVDWLQRRHLPRAIGASLMIILTVSTVGVLAYSLQGQAAVVIDELPAGARTLAATLKKELGTEPSAVQKLQQAADALQKSGKPAVPSGVVRVQVEDDFQARDLLWSGSLGLMSAANNLMMVLFLTYFMLLSEQLFKRKVVEIVGTISQKKATISVFENIAGQIQRFLAIQLFTSSMVAVVTWAALRAVGLEQAALWGLLAGVFNSIPYYGPLLVSAGLTVVGFLQFGTLGMTAAVAGVSLLITTVEGSLLTPMIMGRASSMNHVAVFAGLLFWSWVWGIWGMLLAVPMMMVIKVVCDHVEALQPVGYLLGDQSAVRSPTESVAVG